MLYQYWHNQVSIQTAAALSRVVEQSGGVNGVWRFFDNESGSAAPERRKKHGVPPPEDCVARAAVHLPRSPSRDDERPGASDHLQETEESARKKLRKRRRQKSL
jgi:hypothetical protein